MTTEKVRSEAERLAEETYDFYNKSYKNWLDNLNSWTKTTQGYTGTPLRMDMESWFRPYWDYMQQWGSLFGSYSNMLARTMMPPSSPLRNYSEMTTRWVNAYVRIYDTWFRSLTGILREGWEISRQLASREEVNADRFIDSLKNTYNNISNTVVEIAKDTPFAEVKEINKAINRSLDSFPDQQKFAKDFIRESINLNSNLMDLATLTIKQMAETASNLEKGTLSENGYHKLVDAYSNTLRRTYENLNFPATWQIESKELRDDTANWVKASIEFYLSWLDMSLRMYQGITGSLGEVYSVTSGKLGEGKAPSAEEYSQRWTDAYWRSVDSMVKASRYYETAPRWINAYTNWVVTGNTLYQTLMTPQFSSKEELEEVWKEVERLKKTSEPKSRTAAEPRSKALERNTKAGVRHGAKP